MADDEERTAANDEPEEAVAKPARRRASRRAPAGQKASPAPEAKKEEEKEAPEAPRAPKRAELSPEAARLLSVRRTVATHRPVFGRQQANRYLRIGRDGAWRRPRGLQSKQRRHYGYRPQIVRIGYRGPAAVRGLVPSGFAPVLVHNRTDLDGIDARRQAAIIARTVGTRLRLVLEEEARKLGIHVLNPIVTSEEE